MFVISNLDHRERAVAATIVDVQRKAYRVEADLIGFDGIPNLHETVDDVEALDLTFIGIHDDVPRLVGFVGYRRDRDIVEIDRLAVVPEVHRRGLGRWLLGEVHQRERTARGFEVATGALNLPAIRLYERLGYCQREIARMPHGLEIARFRRDALGDRSLHEAPDPGRPVPPR